MEGSSAFSQSLWKTLCKPGGRFALSQSQRRRRQIDHFL